jgi:predicted site-specific integrase-resolvase
MKLRTFADRVGVRYETAWRWFKAGKIKGRQLDTGTIIVTEDFDEPVEVDVIVVVYARVSANENRPNLDTQAERLSAYCAAKGWKVHKVVKEVGSGINDGRKKLRVSRLCGVFGSKQSGAPKGQRWIVWCFCLPT